MEENISWMNEEKISNRNKKKKKKHTGGLINLLGGRNFFLVMEKTDLSQLKRKPHLQTRKHA